VEIAHVLLMDIVAYSTASMEQQTRFLNELQAIVRETAEFQRAQGNDQLLRLPTGDGMALVFFGDPEAPLRCATQIFQAKGKTPNLQLRMGIHTGPVHHVEDINAARNVSGGGINLAQRVMECGDAGPILTSKVVADFVGQLETWDSAFHDLGEDEVKHVLHIHVYNLYTEHFGNPSIPRKLRAAALLRTRARRKRIAVAAGSTAVIVATVIAASLYSKRAHALTDKDTVVIADFNNNTGKRFSMRL